LDPSRPEPLGRSPRWPSIRPRVARAGICSRPCAVRRMRLISASPARPAALREVLDAGTANLDPPMFRLLKNRSHRGGVARIRHRSDGDTDQRRQIGGFPINGRAAARAEIAVHLPPLVAARVNSLGAPEMTTASAG